MTTIVDISNTDRQRRRRTKSEQQRLHASAVMVSLRMFEEGGYEAVSMRKLAAEVGVPAMSLYRYFPTKAHLIRHIWDDILERAWQRALDRLDAKDAPAVRIASYLDGYLQYWLDNRRHYRVVFAIRDSFGADTDEPGAERVCPDPRRFMQTLGELVAECAGPRRDEESLCRQLVEAVFCQALGFLVGAIGVASLLSADIDALKKRLVREMVEQVTSAFEVAPAKLGRARSAA